ncbi:MAG: nitrate reductase cytochrome c-type subunit [Nitrospirae bacterium]|uniref:nitrate reductase cytochrome c-type subunit n=1 Tax=Candidatus Magnetobacterium casense TaxID=1455061 RepID=UPI000AE4B623|nr:nitrate reductase cytochrome c-type subunit [Candidatus Magnetobacterium casensis]MBF0336395.1 nitrate reductase cytochrome c-type subunit [Nitrospirota bacterium]
MMKVTKVLISLLCVLFLFGMALAADKKSGVSDDEIGLRKTPLMDEDKTMPVEGKYQAALPGSSKAVDRSFENSPPLIPHDTTGISPITMSMNECLNCHIPENAKGVKATAIPKSHFMDISAGKDLKGQLNGHNYNCTQCHVQPSKVTPLIDNEFKPAFRSKNDKHRSNLADKVNEGVELK